MDKKCIRCDIEMTKARFSAGEYAQLEECDKGINSRVCLIDAYVCAKCGHVELFAKKPEIFGK